MQRLGPTKNGKGYAGNVLILSYRTVFMHWWESWLCTRDGCLRAEPLKRSQFHPANFFLSLNLWCKDGPTKKEKDKQWVCWLFWPMDCLYMLRTDSGLCTRDGWLKADPQMHRSHTTYLFLGLDLWCYDLLNWSWTLHKRWVTESK